jgi:transcriptional regulator with XRE-family HTH domain
VAKRANAIDKFIAERLRAARMTAGMSQELAGKYLGVSFQQVQKYEKARNRVSASTLAACAQIYGRPIAWFFAGAPHGLDVEGKSARPDIAAQLLATPYGAELADNFTRLHENEHRRVVAEVAAALAGRLVRHPIAAE